MVRTQIALLEDEYRHAREQAHTLGISLAEYVRRLVRRDMKGVAAPSDISAIFNLGRSDRSDVSENVDKYVGEAVWEEHRRSTGQD